jgi:hypothetical protein
VIIQRSESAPQEVENGRIEVECLKRSESDILLGRHNRSGANAPVGGRFWRHAHVHGHNLWFTNNRHRNFPFVSSWLVFGSFRC